MMAEASDVFHSAVLILTGAGGVKQRLIDAWRGHLAAVREQDVPEALRAPLEELRRAMHAAPAAGGMSAAEVSVRKMSEAEAASHAAIVVEMFAELCSTAGSDAGTGPRLRIVGSVDEDAEEHDLPAFLSRA